MNNNVDLNPLPPYASEWLLPADFDHLTSSIASRHEPNASPYRRWLLTQYRANPTIPFNTLDGPHDGLPERLMLAAQSMPTAAPGHPGHPQHCLKRDIVVGLGYQLASLDLWHKTHKANALHSGLEPITRGNVAAAEAVRTRQKHTLEAASCVFYITAVFWSMGWTGTINLPPEHPVSWIPYTAAPGSATSKPARTLVSDLAHRVMRFRSYQSNFNFSSPITMPSMAGNGDVADYWLTCAGHSTKGVSQTVATLVLKLVRAKEIFDGREDAVLRNILVNREDEWAGPHPASVVPLLSPVLMFLKTPTAIGSLPPGRSFAALHTLGCLPICINGVVDVAVKDFTVGLIDALLQLGFSDGPQVDRWTEVGHTIGRLARILEQSPEPLWLNVPPRAQPAVMLLINNPNLLMVDQDEEYDDDQEVGMDDMNEDTGIVNVGNHGAAVVDDALTSLPLDLPQVPHHPSQSLDPDPSLPSPQLFEAYIAAHLHASTSNQPPSDIQSDATGSILPPRASLVAPHTLSPLPSHSPSRSSSSPPRLSSSVLFPQPSLPVPSSSSSAPPASSLPPPLSPSLPPASPLLVPSEWLDSRSAMQGSPGVLGAAPSVVRSPPGSAGSDSPAIAHGSLQESTSSHLTPLAVKLSLNNQTSPSGSSALLEDDVELDPAATEMQLYSPLEPSREVLSRSQADEGHKSPHFPELLSPCISQHSSPVAMRSTPPSVLPDIGEGQPMLSRKDDEMSISSEDSDSSNEHTGGPSKPEMASAAQHYYMLESQRLSSIGTATRSVSIPPQSASRLELPGTILRASSLMPFDESAQPPSLDDLRPGSASLHAIREDEESLEYDKDEPLHEVSSSVEDDVLSGSISSLTEAEDGEESKAVSKPVLRVLPNRTAREQGIEARKRNIEALGSLREPGRKQSKRARKARENRWKARSTGLEVEVEMEEGEEKEEEEEEEEGEEGEVEYEDVDEQQVRLNSPGTSGQQDDPRYHDDDDDGYESEDPIDLSGPSHQRGTVAASSSDRSVKSSRLTAKEPNRRLKASRIPAAHRNEHDRNTLVHTLLANFGPSYSALPPSQDPTPDLTETNWHTPPKTKGKKSSGSSSSAEPLPGDRRWHAFLAPTMTPSEAPGDIERSLGQFNFPYTSQAQLKPLLAALKMVEYSKDNYMHPAFEPRMLTKEALLAASPEELHQLMPHVVLVKDPAVPAHFMPRPLSTDSEGASGPSSSILVRLTAKMPYDESLQVAYSAIKRLHPGQMLDTSLLDFALRYLHERLQRIGKPHQMGLIAVISSFYSNSVLVREDNPLPLDSHLNWARFFSRIAKREWWFVPLTFDNHHICGMMRNPLACLMKEKTAQKTQVAILDSVGTQGPDSKHNVFWSRLLLNVWTVLGPQLREKLGLVAQMPTVEFLSERIERKFPKVKKQSNDYDCGLHVIRNVQLAMSTLTEAHLQLFASQTAPLFLADVQPMSEYRKTIWGWIVESANDFSSSTLDPTAFHDLQPQERHDLAAKYLRQVGVEGTSTVEAQDHSSGNSKGHAVNEAEAKEIIAGILDSASTEVVVNALNMPSSAAHSDMDIYRAVSCDNRAHAALGLGKAHGLPLGNQPHGLRKWIIASTCGTCHLPHVDANGLCTFVTIKEGYKLWIWGVRTQNSPLPSVKPDNFTWGDTKFTWEWALFDGCIVYAVVLGPGDTIIMPPCTPHAVFSVSKNGFCPTSVLMSGSHFLSTYTLAATLEGAIFHALWHDVWTNALHDDMVFSIDWMLHDLLMHGDSRPDASLFVNNYIFALIAYARLAPWLRSLPHRPHVKKPTWLLTFDPMDDLRLRLQADESTKAATQRMLAALTMIDSKADKLAANLAVDQDAKFQAFWETTYYKLATEILRRTNYNIGL